MRALPIIRSRTGCFTCRRRKKKCNEEKPVCSGCRRNRLECSWPAEVAVSPSRRKSVGDSQKTAQQHRPQHRPQQPDAIAISPKPSSQPPQLPQPRATSISSSSDSSSPILSTPNSDTRNSIASTLSPVQAHVKTESDNDHSSLALTLNNSFPLDPSAVAIPPNISLLPSFGNDSSDLLSYYLARTANSMGNGSTDVNPFISKLVPLAFSNPLVLQLILAQSASHRQAANSYPAGNEVAQKYYTDSLRMFRNVVGEYVSGKLDNTLVLTVGSLILCLTEVARGDVHGTIFDHLKASESMLTLLLNRPTSDMPSDLSDFLVEYYMHMSAASMISTDPKHTVPTLSHEIETLARSLVDKGYVGQLSGCWLEMLTVIPQVFHLGQRMMTSANTPHSPDDIITFGLLQSQIMAFSPDASVNPYSRLAGLVFKQGVLLYLWSILGLPHQQVASSAHANFISMAVAEAVALLNQFPANLRVNTSLCWPLAVIGCCTADPEVQDFLRQRLRVMHETIGLGNMRETLTLMEHVWVGPRENMSPWKLAQTMEEHQLWISFA